MCRSTAAPLMAMAGMAGTAVGVAIAVIREKADRRSMMREAEKEREEQERLAELEDSAEESAGEDDSNREA